MNVSHFNNEFHRLSKIFILLKNKKKYLIIITIKLTINYNLTILII